MVFNSKMSQTEKVLIECLGKDYSSKLDTENRNYIVSILEESVVKGDESELVK